jgi:uncharacterized protein (DUF1778 family)
MQASSDTTGETDERSTERMNSRTRPQFKRVAAHEETVLLPVDHATFFAALDTPPEPTAKLREAAERYRCTISSQ